MSVDPIVRPPVWAALLLCVLTGQVLGQDPHGEGTAQPDGGVVEGVDYRVYDRAGHPVSLSDVVAAARGGDALLIGEEHGDRVGHAVELLLLALVFQDVVASAERRPVILSMEMFERDVQYVVDEYLGELISEDHFLASARPWPDYEVRYRPLVEFARAHGLPVVASNAPRRYVNRVTRQGPASLDALSDRAKAFLPPLPFPGPSELYRDQWDAAMSGAGVDADSIPSDSADVASPDVDVDVDEERSEPESPQEAAAHPPNPNAIQAQALWDAAMGHAIARTLFDHLGGIVVHVAGSFHVARDTGIPERLLDYRPGTVFTTVVLTATDDVDAWSEEEHRSLGDFVVLTRSTEEPSEG